MPKKDFKRPPRMVKVQPKKGTFGIGGRKGKDPTPWVTQREMKVRGGHALRHDDRRRICKNGRLINNPTTNHCFEQEDEERERKDAEKRKQEEKSKGCVVRQRRCPPHTARHPHSLPRHLGHP